MALFPQLPGRKLERFTKFALRLSNNWAGKSRATLPSNCTAPQIETTRGAFTPNATLFLGKTFYCLQDSSFPEIESALSHPAPRKTHWGSIQCLSDNSQPRGKIALAKIRRAFAMALSSPLFWVVNRCEFLENE
jgi:hypothetical protein